MRLFRSRLLGPALATLSLLVLVAPGPVYRQEPPEPRLCDERPRTPAPAVFGAAVQIGDGHTNITAVAFGRLGARTVAVSSGEEGTLRVWDVPSLAPAGEPVDVGRPLSVIGSRTFRGEELAVERDQAPVIRLSGRPTRVTAGDELVLTDVATGHRVGPRAGLGEDNGVNGLVVLNIGGRPTAVVNDDGGDENEPGPDPLRFFDLRTGRPLAGIAGDFSAVRKVSLRDRVALLTVNQPLDEEGTASGAITLWDPVTRRALAVIPGPRLPAADGRIMFRGLFVATRSIGGHAYALTGGADDTVRLWDLDTARLVASAGPEGHTDEIEWVTATTGGAPIAVTAGYDGRIVVWDLAARRRSGPPMTHPGGPVHMVTAGRTAGRPVVAGQGGGLLRLWDLTTRTGIGEPIPVPETARAVEFGGRILLLDAAGGRTRVTDLATRATVGVPVAVSAARPGRYTLIDLDGRTAVVEVRRRSRVSDLATGRRLRTVPGVGGDSGAFTTGRLRCAPVVLSGRGEAVRIWDPRTGKEVAPPLRGHRKGVQQVLSGRLGDRPVAVTLAGEGTVRVWDLTRSAVLGTVDTGPAFVRVTLGAVAGRGVLVAAGRDERVRMWDLGPAPG
ncbi:WD40 repeat domain-containing protein [Sphaerisporangium sp. B11E5]|uniref:WD40 repeat domain-containing protein n=1 Tax=Sphaerisporangium sp. B11E5 TaxID=3153563 RepID=UPI00325F4A7F